MSSQGKWKIVRVNGVGVEFGSNPGKLALVRVSGEFELSKLDLAGSTVYTARSIVNVDGINF